MPTLVASSRNYPSQTILVYDAMVNKGNAVNNLINRLFDNAKLNAASNRLDIRKGRYMYTPSNEYLSIKSKLVRIKSC